MTARRGGAGADEWWLSGDADALFALVDPSSVGAERRGGKWVVRASAANAKALYDALAEHSYGVRGLDLPRYF